jgi:hypothetical protein
MGHRTTAAQSASEAIGNVAPAAAVLPPSHARMRSAMDKTGPAQ